MGRFSVDIELANYADVALAEQGALASGKVRRTTLSGVVDSGATKLVLPAGVIQQLGLLPNKKITVKYADGRMARRDAVVGVFLELQGRQGVFSAIVEPKRTTALIGAIVLEDLDLLVDCVKQRVIPRHPRGQVFEIE